MDDEDFPRGKRQKLDTDSQVKETRSTAFYKELFSDVNCDFTV